VFFWQNISKMATPFFVWRPRISRILASKRQSRAMRIKSCSTAFLKNGEAV
jgi:hypothetical protein